ncbi:hypothetical protein QDX91_004529 [Salmonella enterica]|nr:hypothetical protein [Salmonella enterica subsp. enterica serovar Sandiego]EEC0251888.1 hypothetical protein [Salmonella enterica subsp. enterica]EJW2129091.1 hypothetical protein [Salmonella enterica]EEE4266615.1 hypothetical protein [Salmonella enterica subsp. enterica serovar Sandiego]EKT1705023.1 hypothetical protein [Salmonella enterica]
MKNIIYNFILPVSVAGVTVMDSYDTVKTNTELLSPICRVVQTEDVYQNFRSVSGILAGEARDIIVQQMPFTFLLSGCQGKILYMSVLASSPRMIIIMHILTEVGRLNIRYRYPEMPVLSLTVVQMAQVSARLWFHWMGMNMVG